MYQSQSSSDSSGVVFQSQKVRYGPVGQKNKKRNKTTTTTKTKNTKHLTRIRIFLKTEIFFSPFQGLPLTRNRRFRAQKGHVLETVPREERHFETISFVFTCGQTKRRFSNEKMSYIVYCQYHACSVTCMLSYFYHFSLFLWMGESNSFLCMAARNVHVRQQ